MNILKYFSSFICLFIILITLNSCGASGPTNAPTTNTSTINNPALTVNAYQASGHRDIITANAIDLLLNSPDLTPKQKSILVAYRADIENGAVNEDNPIIRAVNHFWDPTRDKPLTDDGMTSVILYNQTAIQWAKNGDNLMYDTAKQNFVTNIAFYDPTNPSVKISGLGTSMTDLGHVIHMFQDMTSVPHTRNDNHVPLRIYGGASGYENYVVVGNYNPPKVNTYIRIVDDADLLRKFEDLATDTNNHFFSEDSIPITGQAPWRSFDSPGLPAGTGYLGNNIISTLVFADKNDITHRIDYSLDDTVHKAYADILVPKSIEYTAGVIKYFLSLKGKGAITIDNPADNTTATSSSVNISGSLTYYAASASVSLNGTYIGSIIVTFDQTKGKYVFGPYTVKNLQSGNNIIKVEAFNENVDAAPAQITIKTTPAKQWYGAIYYYGAVKDSKGRWTKGGFIGKFYHPDSEWSEYVLAGLRYDTDPLEGGHIIGQRLFDWPKWQGHYDMTMGTTDSNHIYHPSAYYEDGSGFDGYYGSGSAGDAIYK